MTILFDMKTIKKKIDATQLLPRIQNPNVVSLLNRVIPDDL